MTRAAGTPRFLLPVVAAAAAAALLWLGFSTHIKRACVIRDTPYLPLCAPEGEHGQRAAALRDRLRDNPGDSTAWTALLAAQARLGQTEDGVLRGAAAVAPYHATVLRWQAARALEKGNLPEGVGLLVQMLQTRNSPGAARVLAQVAASDDGVALLKPHLDQAESWLPSVLAAMASLKIPPSQALPLVAEALARGSLPDTARRAYMRSLKANGLWLDAHGLWLAQRKEAVPLLYNSSFDQALEPDGFDWEFAAAPRSRAGVVIEQQPEARRGLVLTTEFRGRSFAVPIVRQYVFASPGAYRLRGEYMASKFRSEQGLTWNVACTSGQKAVVARSDPLQDTGGVWKPFVLEFTIPPDCGPVASLQLEPAAAFEARTGMRGLAAFDAFSLARTVQAE